MCVLVWQQLGQSPFGHLLPGLVSLPVDWPGMTLHQMHRVLHFMGHQAKTNEPRTPGRSLRSRMSAGTPNPFFVLKWMQGVVPPKFLLQVSMLTGSFGLHSVSCWPGLCVARSAQGQPQLRQSDLGREASTAEPGEG